MNIKITVYENHRIESSRKRIGSTTEHNANILDFTLPTQINGTSTSNWSKKLIFETDTGASYVYTLSGNTFPMPRELTIANKLNMQFEFAEGTVFSWKSFPLTFELADSVNSSNINPLQTYRGQWEEEAATDLADALTHSATESELSPIPDYDQMTLDELVDEVEDTIMLTDEKQFNLDCFQSVIDSLEREQTIANYTNFPIFIDGWGDSTHLITLPYIKTDRVSFAASNGSVRINQYVKEVGFDFTLCREIASNLTDHAKNNLKKFMMTGFKNVDTSMGGNFQNLFNNCVALEELYFDELNLNRFAVGNKTYNSLFISCNNLKIIGGFNKDTRKIDNSLGRIDFTGCTNSTNMFKSCSSLEEVRFKPCTSLNDGLAVSLDLSSCGVISKESICSLINALQYYTPGTVKSVKVAYPTIYNHMITDWYCKVVDELMHVEICESTGEGAITFEQAIGNLNWTVTH